MGEPANGMGQLVRSIYPNRIVVAVNRLPVARIITRVYVWVSRARKTRFILQRSKVSFGHFVVRTRSHFHAMFRIGWDYYV